MNPFLQVSAVSFLKNAITFKIKNIGAGNAYEIGIAAYYEPVILTGLARDDNDSLPHVAKIGLKFQDVFEIEDSETRNRKWIEFFNEGKLREYYPRLWFERINKKLIDPYITNNGEIKSNRFVTYPNTKYTNFVITPHENDELVTCEPLFNVEYVDVNKMSNSSKYIFKVSSKETLITRHFKLNELITIMKHNKVDFFHLVFDLVYKNQYEDVLERVSLTNFVFSIREHATLQEAFEQDFSIGKIIGHREIEQKLKGIPSFQYFHAKSNLNNYE